MKHKHAELMMEYARDAMETDKPWERWEFKFEGENDWRYLIDQAIWRNDCEYRRKPITININGFEVPEPVREPLKVGTIYYIPSIYYNDVPNSFEWRNDSTDSALLKKGVVHLSNEAAIKHMEAIISFTRIEK